MYSIDRGTDRGQTTQDFAVGIGLFLLVIVFVVTFLPSVLAPFGGIDDTERTSQAERVAIEVVEDTSTDPFQRTLDRDDLDEVLGSLDDPTNFGLAEHRSVNITLESLDGEQVKEGGGAHYSGESAGTWTRIVTTTDGDCVEGCRLIIRVW